MKKTETALGQSFADDDKSVVARRAAIGLRWCQVQQLWIREAWADRRSMAVPCG